MKRISLFMPSSIGLLLLAVIAANCSWDKTNVWIPISVTFLALSAIVFAVTKKINSIDDRLKELESKKID